MLNVQTAGDADPFSTELVAGLHYRDVGAALDQVDVLGQFF